jgi:hypothetical protein
MRPDEQASGVLAVWRRIPTPVVFDAASDAKATLQFSSLPIGGKPAGLDLREVREAMEYGDLSPRIEPKRGDVRPVSVSSPAGVARSSISPPVDADQIGDQLFRAPFSSLAALASLPWKLLYRKEGLGWLNLSRFTHLVRYLEVPRTYEPLAIVSRLRILVVRPDPVEHPRPKLEAERKLEAKGARP